MDDAVRGRRHRLARHRREPDGGGDPLSLLTVQNLSIAYDKAAVLRGISLQVAEGESYGLVGESGCGKSTVALACLRALPPGGAITGGTITLAGQDIAQLDAPALRRLRARTASMVYQDPARALNPTLTIGRQLRESYEVLGAADPTTESRMMLDRVRIARPDQTLRAYPHELSGGMQQRVVIGMALAKRPALLILDEPTTGLDATVEAEILALITALRRESGTALLFISHNISVVSRMCDRVGILYAGMLVEEGNADAVLRQPIHPYTTRLLRCLPAGRRKTDGPLDSIPGTLPSPGPLPPGCVFAPRCPLADDICRTTPPPSAGEPGHGALCHHPGALAAIPPAPARAILPGPAVLRAEHISKRYGVDQILNDISLTLHAGETLGLVGESGSGKTTLARILLGLQAADPGGGVTMATPLAGFVRARSRAQRQALQIVFQNPDSALNRAHTVRHILTRPLARLAKLRGAAQEARLQALVAAVRLTPGHLPLRPAQLSGGLKQRVAIARAFAGAPSVVICDEPTSALDVSVQAAILNLLAELQRRDGVSLLFISHDLGVIRYLADRVAVLHHGQIVEEGPTESVFTNPQHPYTAALLAAQPLLDSNAV